MLCSTVFFSKAGLFFSDDILRLWLDNTTLPVADEADCLAVLTQL